MIKSPSDVDLNINNYELPELLKLFDLNIATMNEENLKYAKKLVYKLHPDKSKLPKDYFEFYLNAYNLIVSVFLKEQQSKKDKDKKYSGFLDETNKEEQPINGKKLREIKDYKEFNKDFNKMFEQNKVSKENDGYEEWFKSNEGISQTKDIPFSEMENMFELKKQEIQSIVKYTGYDDTQFLPTNGTLINQEDVSSYSSDLFSSLPFQDLKQAYTETIIPVTKKDFENIKKYNSVGELENEREKHLKIDKSISNSRKEFDNQTSRVYDLYKQAENMSFTSSKSRI